MVVVVKNLVPACDTFDQGEILRLAVLKQMENDEKVSVSFEGISYVTSSFVNAAFVGLLNDLDIEQIKTRMSVIRSHRQINDLVKSLVSHSAAKKAAHVF